MDWIKSIIEKHTKEDGKVDMAAVMAEINTEAPKNIVPKDKFNSQATELKTAKETIETLKKDNGDNATLQQKIKDHEATIAGLQKASADKDKQVKVKEAFEKAGATDVDYLVFKSGGLDKFELDKDGNIKDLDNLVKQAKENAPSFFKAADPNAKPPGPNVISNKLPGGDPADPNNAIASQFAAALRF